jgi:hypothetical protein
MKYLVIGKGGPGFSSPEEAKKILNEIVMPSFDELIKLEKEKKILAGGLPVGDRAFIFIIEASSNDEVDRILRKLPMWGVLNWKVKPLQDFSTRAEDERTMLKELNK